MTMTAKFLKRTSNKKWEKLMPKSTLPPPPRERAILLQDQVQQQQEEEEEPAGRFWDGSRGSWST
jgi:hypothetical protein